MWIKEALKLVFIIVTIASMSVFFYMLMFSIVDTMDRVPYGH